MVGFEPTLHKETDFESVALTTRPHLPLSIPTPTIESNDCSLQHLGNEVIRPDELLFGFGQSDSQDHSIH